MKKVLITGSAGLVGSEAVVFFIARGFHVVGIDNNMRKHFFGEDGDTSDNIMKHPKYTHYSIDIRDPYSLDWIMETHKPDLIIHSAAQPSHDWAAKDPVMDFEINANGTLRLLEAMRKRIPESVFIYVSTNKVYGDNPNKIALKELETRYEPYDVRGINENMKVDHCLHSLFGVSKLAGDLLTQEYGRYFGLKTGIFRCGCITGQAHKAAELHGFLAYVAKCKKEGRKYKVYGYKGKQVRDNIHAFDLVNAFYHFYKDPKCGEVYNMGGGKYNNISVIEALKMLDLDYEYVDCARKGDHIWYVTDVSKFRLDYPDWGYKYNIEKIIEELMA